MGPFAFANHLVNLIVPALALAAVAAALAKWAWRAELAASSWWRLALAAASVNVVVTLVGLVWTGRDGKMATYAAMVLATAATLWWQGFGRGRR
jgi:hypothetical protein